MKGRFMAAIVLCAVVAAFGATLLDAKAAQSRQTDATALLPDLDVITPMGLIRQVRIIKGKKRFKLGFISAAQNVGAGPMIVSAARDLVSRPQMEAQQVIERTDGTTVTVPNVGTLQYVVDKTHRHWHLLPFMNYELRRVSDYKLMRPDEKTGYCLGDRFKAPTLKLPSTPTAGVYKDHCGLDHPELTEIEEGISVGYGDDYTQIRDGQDIDVTGIPAGKYYLVHRVNKDRRLKESSYANNTSSLLIELTWPRGMKAWPDVVILAACSNTDRCKKGTVYDRIK
jgi:hypothetical protein